MKKIIIATVFLLASQGAWSIRFVGNGGGDAEMKAFQYLETLSLWTKMCKSITENCIIGFSKPMYDQLEQYLESENLQELEFVNSQGFDGQHIVNGTDGKRLVLTFSSVYIDNKHPKSNDEIFAEILRAISLKWPNPFSVSDKSIRILPAAKKHPRFQIYLFRHGLKDILYSDLKSLEDCLNSNQKLQNISILSETFEGYIFKLLPPSSLSGSMWELSIYNVNNGSCSLSIAPYFVN